MCMFAKVFVQLFLNMLLCHRALAASSARLAFFTTGSRKLAVVKQAGGL